MLGSAGLRRARNLQNAPGHTPLARHTCAAPRLRPVYETRALGLDIVGPFDTAATSACRFVITLTDYYSKWSELGFSHTATTEVVTDFLTFFSCHSNLETIITDNGPHFTSTAFAPSLDTRGVSHKRTSVYQPAANGAIGRFHRSLRSCIQTAVQQSQPRQETVTNWPQESSATLQVTTSISLYEPLYGRKMHTK